MNPIHINPLKDIKSIDDVKKTVSNIMESRTEGKDPFWDGAVRELLEALIFYVCATTLNPDVHDVFRLLQYTIAPPNPADPTAPQKSSVDIAFENLERNKGKLVGNAALYEEEAIKAYKTFKLASAKTASGVVITAQECLQPYVLS